MGEESYPLSEYELKRLERIRKNEEYLNSLGLGKKNKDKWSAMTQATQRNQKRTKKRIKRVLSPEQRSQECRQSKRLKKDDQNLVMLSYQDDNEETEMDQSANNKMSSPNSTPTTTLTSPPRRPRPPVALVPLELTPHEKQVLSQNTMDQNYLHKFQEFLVYHNKISDQNVRNVMRQVRKLATGQGVHYDSPTYGWKPHQIFKKGVCVTPLSDFVLLLQEAREAEDKWGRDHGNGWLLSHPLKKMLLYQQFCLRNPDFLTSQCRLKEYYATHDETMEEEENQDDQEVEKEEEKDEEVQVEESSSSDDDDGDDDYSEEKKDDANEEKTNGDEKKRKDKTTTVASTPIVNGTSPALSPRKKRGRPRLDRWVGERVAKKFEDDVVYTGIIQKYDVKNKYWFVVYDDGDQEEMDQAEVQQALQLYADTTTAQD